MNDPRSVEASVSFLVRMIEENFDLLLYNSALEGILVRKRNGTGEYGSSIQ